MRKHYKNQTGFNLFRRWIDWNQFFIKKSKFRNIF